MSDTITPISDGEWLDENRITSTSQHFIQVEFLVKEDLSGNNLLGIFAGGKEGAWSLILPRNYITSATFDGVAVGARKGTIDIIDPEGLWSTALKYISDYKNSLAAIGQHNMIIHFGWVGLNNDGSGENEFQEIPSILLKTGFDMTEDGSITIKLEFIENSENLLRTIKANTMGDLNILNSEVDDNKISGLAHISDVLTFITDINSEVGSITEQIKNLKIRFDFEETNEDACPFGEDSIEVKIRIGDTLKDIISDLISMAVPVKDDGYIQSYEMINKLIDQPDPQGTSDRVTIFQYRWTKTPTPAKLAELTGIERVNAMGSGSEPPISGPILLWKKQSDNRLEKSLISFKMDLKMLDYASSMMRSELEDRLGGMSETHWDNLSDLASDADEALLGMNMTQLANYANSNASGDEDDLFAFKENFFSKAKNSIFKTPSEMKAAAVEFTSAIKGTKNNTQSQIQTIIQNNVFKAKATIIGDPSFGTIYTMYTIAFQTDFEAVGEFASFFTRPWLLTKCTHRMEEGGFFTDLDLMAFPPELPIDETSTEVRADYSSGALK